MKFFFMDCFVGLSLFLRFLKFVVVLCVIRFNIFFNLNVIVDESEINLSEEEK